MLTDPKPGKKVALTTIGLGGRTRIATIVKVTPTGRVVLDNGQTFRPSGISMNGTYLKDHIDDIDDENLSIIAHEEATDTYTKLVGRIMSKRIKDVDTETIRSATDCLARAAELIGA